jgi:steroid 5-alpha reductase family enzyme
MTDPFLALFPLVAGITLGTWLLSVFTREYSWVDRIWSIAPPVYAVLVAFTQGFSDSRLNLVAVLVTAWGARLTFNFWRRGGYAKGGEDYRWAILRDMLGPVAFQGFNATFISPYQNLLIWLLVAPTSAMVAGGAPLGAADTVLAALFLGLLAFEFVADQQQFDFQTAKYAARARGEAHADFRTDGLFRFSRHPNYFAEVSIWWVVYGFSVAAGGGWLNWTIVAPILLSLLFDGSTRFTEWLTLKKYAHYADYQRSTSRIVPLPPRAGR